MNPLVLNRENIFSDIKFLICIHIIPSVKFAIFETKFAKVSSLVIFSHENILSSGTINLTNVKSKNIESETRYSHFRHAIYIRYAAMSRNKG